MEASERTEYHIFEPDPAMTERQRKLLNSWLVPKTEE
jgi:SAM-dependent MidA family methyltransferase